MSPHIGKARHSAPYDQTGGSRPSKVTCVKPTFRFANFKGRGKLNPERAVVQHPRRPRVARMWLYNVENEGVGRSERLACRSSAGKGRSGFTAGERATRVLR